MSARYNTTDLAIFFDIGVKKGATHMIVMYQHTGTTNRHHYVMPGQYTEVEITKHPGKLTEVYNLNKPKTPQLLAHRTMEF